MSDLPLRLRAKIAMEHDCWNWIGSINNTGYGMISWNGRNQTAHRVLYEVVKGAIPEGLHIDHLCRNRRCVNPAHLEAVTQAENNRRSKALVTHCPHGHEYTPDNIRASKQGKRGCKTCHRNRENARRKRATINAR